MEAGLAAAFCSRAPRLSWVRRAGCWLVVVAAARSGIRRRCRSCQMEIRFQVCRVRRRALLRQRRVREPRQGSTLSRGAIGVQQLSVGHVSGRRRWRRRARPRSNQHDEWDVHEIEQHDRGGGADDGNRGHALKVLTSETNNAVPDGVTALQGVLAVTRRGNAENSEGRLATRIAAALFVAHQTRARRSGNPTGSRSPPPEPRSEGSRTCC